MEPPRQREVATAEGDETPGWNRDPPGWNRDLPGTGEELSAAWNGTCGGRAERNGAREPPVPSPGGPGCSCSCRGVPTAPLSPDRRGPEEEEEEEGAGGARRARRRLRHRPYPREKEEEEGGGKRGRGRRGGGNEGPGPGLGLGSGPGSESGPGPGLGSGPRPGLGSGSGPGGCPRGLLGSCCRRGCGAPGGLRGWVRFGSRGLRFGFGFLLRVLRALGAFLLLLLFLLLRWGRRSGQRLRDWTHRTLRRNRGGGRGLRDPPGMKEEEEEEAVGRLSAMAEVPEEQLNPFAVLGVATTAPHTELRRAYRRLAVLVHPDKNPHPRAEAAFKVLRAAWDMVGSPERRREHEMKLLAQGELARSVGEFLRRVQEELREALNTMGCSKCRGKHRRFELDRDPQRARFCAACGGPHPAEEGDLWAESSLLGLRVTYLALMDGRVYDITEWAACQRVGISPDTHRVPYHISFGTRGRTRTKGTPPDLQEFFTRVFQGSSRGGSFPPPPPPPPPSEGPNHPQGPPQTPQGPPQAPQGPPQAPQGPPQAPRGPPKPEGTPPRAEGKHRRRKRPRRPLQR